MDYQIDKIALRDQFEKAGAAQIGLRPSNIRALAFRFFKKRTRLTYTCITVQA
jgi:hypothetical protein